MARLTDKETLATPAAADLIHVVDVSDTTANAAGTSKKSTISSITSTIEAGLDVYTQSQTDTLLDGKADTSHTHTKSEITDFSDADYAAALGTDDNYVTDAEKTVIGNTSGTNTGDETTETIRTKGALMDDEVTNLADVKSFDPTDYATSAQGAKADTAVQSVVAGTNVTVDDTDPLNPIVNASGGGGSSHDPVTVTDSSEIDFTLTDQDITASLIAGSIDESKLDTSVNASLDLADSASQPGHTHTASDVTDFDTEVANNADVTANTAKVSNATHTGDVTGDTALTIANDAVTAAKLDESDDFTPTGAWDFGGATDVELPNGAAPTVDTDGQVAIDTDIADLSHGLMKYYAGEELVTISMPVAQLAALNNGWGPTYNAAADEFQMTAPASGSGDTYNVSVNTLTIDSTAGTSDTWGVLGGAVNGSNTTYTVSTGIYKSGTLKVFKNNLLLVQGTGEDWVETTPGSGTFDFNTAPLSGDVITVEYSDQDTTANSLIVEKDTVTSSTTGTIADTIRNALVNAASADVTVTLPALSDIDSVGISITKIDTSANSVIIATPGSETINNASTYEITSPDFSVRVISDGTNYRLIV